MDGEHALHLTDPGARFWSPTHVQLDSLRTSQSIIVGRAVILSQPMMPLPKPEEFDLQRESSRFGWLLYGKPSEMTEIHGGCGFSKKLLHLMSQVRYCAARIQQNSSSPIAPMTASFLLEELVNLHQWTNETGFNSEDEPPSTPIAWARSQAQNYVIDSSAKMTYVTAEAWRLAAMVYTQCRALRYVKRNVLTTHQLTYLQATKEPLGGHGEFVRFSPLRADHAHVGAPFHRPGAFIPHLSLGFGGLGSKPQAGCKAMVRASGANTSSECKST